MNIIIEILGIAALGFIFSSVITPNLPKMFKRKPFTCESCMSWWIAIGYFNIEFGILAILPAAICYVVASLIWKL
jgi:hypothetical protein